MISRLLLPSLEHVPPLRLMPGINGIKASGERKIARRCRRNALKERQQRDHQRVLAQRSGRDQQHVVLPANYDMAGCGSRSPTLAALGVSRQRVQQIFERLDR
jgi:hypothetical protein